MKKFELFSFVIVTALAISCLTIFYARTTETKHLDSVFLFEASGSIIKTGQPTSSSISTLEAALPNYSKKAAEVCSLPLLPNSVPYNVLDNHAYFILYPISVISFLIGPDLTFAFLNSLSHVLLIALPFLFIRLWGGGVISGLSMSIIIALYPGLYLSAVGDYYLDRLAMPAILLFLFSLHHSIRTKIPLYSSSGMLVLMLISALFAILCTERAAIMILATTLFHLAFFPKIRQDRKTFWLLLSLSSFVVLYLVVYFFYIYVGITGGGGLLKNMVSISERYRSPGLVPFLLVNALSFLVLILFSGWRYQLLAVGSMVPNFMITMGGAELNGWSTHYHTMYMPYLVGASTFGMIFIQDRLTFPIFKNVVFPILFAVFAFMSSLVLDPSKGSLGYPRFDYLKQSVFYKSTVLLLFPSTSAELAISKSLRILDLTVAKGTRVSAVEGVMPALYRNRELYLFPIGIDQADYLVVSGTVSSQGDILFQNFLSYHGETENTAQNVGFLKRSLMNGFVLHKHIPALGVIIMKRPNVKDQLE